MRIEIEATHVPPALEAGGAALEPQGEPLPAGFTWLAAARHGAVAARLAYGVRGGLAGAPGVTGMIGWYDALDAEAGVALLRAARERLAALAPARIVGPMNGGTWGRYRLALPRSPEETGGGPAFLGEPTNPEDYPRQWEAAGFRPRWLYESRLVPCAAGAGAPPETARSASGIGATLRPLSLDAIERDLRAVYDLTLQAFADNPFYAPIDFEGFAAMHRRMLPLLDPDLVLLAEDDGGGLLGYVFAYPDPLAEPERPRVVLKTLATAPRARGAGLGGALTERIRTLAAARRADVIHALMHVANHSTRISSAQGARPFRRYALFGWEG